MDDIVYYIWLSLIFNNRCEQAMRVLRTFGGSPKAVYDAGEEEIRAAAEEGTSFSYPKRLDEAEAIIEWCERNNTGVIAVNDAAYPAKLRSIPDPPPVLYYRGRLPNFDSRLTVAMVGTRRMTEYGKHSAYTISYDLAKAGAIIVSGMALGIDGASHRGALDASGLTAAVLGSGIDVIYPREHEGLYAELTSCAVVLSEFKPSSPPNKFHFPIRNRVISALSDCTFVVEADERSGSLITAKTAVSQGRLCAALPGSVGEAGSRGTNTLIKEGAKPVTCAADIISEFRSDYSATLDESKLRGVWAYGARPASPSKTKISLPGDSDPSVKRTMNRPAPRQPQRTAEKPVDGSPAPRQTQFAPAKQAAPPPKTPEPPARPRPVMLTPSEKRVYDALPDDKAVNADFLSEAGIPVSDILVALTMLEIKGLIDALPGAMYKKI